MEKRFFVSSEKIQNNGLNLFCRKKKTFTAGQVISEISRKE